ncbi:MAG: 3-methyl-2-oxobutanoate hydroxymethyltransferase [Gammaproteobacteria bacterium]
MNIKHFQRMKQTGEKITLVTCYDYWSARIIAQSDIDCVLVGDSAAMVMHGQRTTIPATVELMATHTRAVAKGAPSKFIIADLPFLSYRKGLIQAMEAVEQLLQAGAQAIKLEGADGNEEIIRHCVKSGIPVMGHLGLTPQSVHQLGGFRVQGKEETAAKQLQAHALTLAECGCFAVVLEMIPGALAEHITAALPIPTIGIGAGAHTDGQILVLQDLLGMTTDIEPTFVKKYLEGAALIKEALNQYHQEVKQKVFPKQQHTYENAA